MRCVNSVCAALALIVASTTWAFDIVKDGNPACTCLVDGSPRQLALADELVSYVQKITGAKLSVVDDPAKITGCSNRIIRFDAPYQAKTTDEFAAYVSEDDKILEITGSNERGTAYALYAVIEKLGVRFWSSHYETIPRTKNLSFPVDFKISESPAFELRAPGGECEVMDSAWCTKMRLNTGLNGKMADRMHFECIETLCLKYLNPKKYFNDHPDWYAWRPKAGDGGPGRSPSQPCLSNQEVLDKLLEEVKDDLKAHPKLTMVSVAYNDNDAICRCDKCLKAYENGGSSTMIAKAANFVARGIAKDWPNVKVSVLSYWFTCPPPKGIEFEPNVVVCFCVGTNMLRPERTDEALVKRFDAWLALTGNQAVMWDYFANFKRFSFAVPNIDLMADDIRWVHSKGVRGYTSQLSLGGTSHLCDLRSYIYCKCLWNPDREIEPMIDEWFDNTCGSGSDLVKKYYHELVAIRDGNPAKMGMYGGNLYDFVTADHLIRWQKYFEEALELTKDDAGRHEMVERMSVAPLMDIICFYHKKNLKQAAEACKYPLRDRLVLVKQARGLFDKYNKGCYFSEHLGFRGALKTILTPEEMARWVSFEAKEKARKNGNATLELDDAEPSLDGDAPAKMTDDIDTI